MKKETIYLCEKDLARRCNLSIKTLQSWRFLTCPAYVKISGGIHYGNHEILEYETKRTYLGKSKEEV